MQITHQLNLPAGTMQGRRILVKGEVINTWCSCCGHATEHRYQPDKYPVLVCLVCRPEAQNGA